MTFEETKELLNLCDRAESRDHAFGDREIYWTLDGEDVAEGYFGGGTESVFVLLPEEVNFQGLWARRLSKCGKTVTIGRNDETGPDEYGGY